MNLHSSLIHGTTLHSWLSILQQSFLCRKIQTGSSKHLSMVRVPTPLVWSLLITFSPQVSMLTLDFQVLMNRTWSYFAFLPWIVFDPLNYYYIFFIIIFVFGFCELSCLVEAVETAAFVTHTPLAGTSARVPLSQEDSDYSNHPWSFIGTPQAPFMSPLSADFLPDLPASKLFLLSNLCRESFSPVFSICPFIIL